MRYVAVVLLSVLATGAYAQGRTVVDKAPSGRETQETMAGRNSSVSHPGRDGTVDVTRSGRTQSLNFDANRNEVTGRDHRDTTVIYQKK